MSSELKVLYIGQDEGYWETISSRLKSQFPHYAFSFKDLNATTEETIQTLIIQVINEKPSLIYLDFSKNAEDFLHLARLLKRVAPTASIPIIGLLEHNTAEAISKFSIAAGITCNHIKSGEYHDVVYDGVNVAVPTSNEELTFAMAQLNDNFSAHELVKIGYVTEKSIHIEIDRKLKVGEKLSLNNHFTTNKVIRSKLFEVKAEGDSNTYYDKNYWYDLDFEFIDPVKKDPDASADLIKERENERATEVVSAKKKMKTWIADNLERSYPKIVKMLIVDNNLNIYNAEPRSDRFNYVIRCQPYLTDVSKELKVIMPQIIAFQFDAKPKKTNDKAEVAKTETEDKAEKTAKSAEDKKAVVLDAHPKNDESMLAQIISFIKATDKYKPFILLFNAKTTDSTALQKQYDYTQIIAQTEEVQMPLIIKMADTLEKKLGKLMTQTPQSRVVFKKNNPQSFAEITHEIKIFNICESEVYFTSDSHLPQGTCLRLTTPAPMCITIVHHTDASAQITGKEGYRGLINTVGEDEKKKLRQFVNTVFFRDHEAAKNAEKEEFKKIQDAAVKRKEEQARKEAEMAQKKKEEEEKAKKKGNELKEMLAKTNQENAQKEALKNQDKQDQKPKDEKKPTEVPPQEKKKKE